MKVIITQGAGIIKGETVDIFLLRAYTEGQVERKEEVMPQTDTPSEQPEHARPHPARPSKEKEISAKDKGASDLSGDPYPPWTDALEHLADNDWLE